MNETLLYAGIGCVLAAIVGGGFKGLGIQVPLISTVSRQLLLAISGLVLVATSGAGDRLWERLHPDPDSELRAGLARYDAGQYHEAIRHFKNAAAAGNAEAQYHYGEMLWHGEGILTDEKAGLEWVRRSADNGFALAQSSVASHLIQSGANAQEGRAWAKRSAAQGDPVGYYLLSRTENDPAVKVANLRTAAQKGYPDAQRDLAHSLASNLKSDQTLLPDVVNWLGRAARQGDFVSHCAAAALYSRWQESDDHREQLLWHSLLCQRNWAQIKDASKSQTFGQLDKMRQDAEMSLPMEARFRVRKKADQWSPTMEGKVRHMHFDWRSR